MVIKCELYGIESRYYSGQTITGKICLTLEERILIRAISLKMDGYAITEWNSNKNKSEKLKILKGRDDFIASTNFLLGSEESTSILMPQGSYTYSFSCDIPETCPSSYNSIFGNIRYQMQINLIYDNKTEEILKENIVVIKQLDLRPLTSALKLPVDMELYETKWFCEFWKTPLCLYVNLSQGAYVPGDTISVYAKLINDGIVPLRSISVSLNQVVIYTSKIPREQTLTERFNIVKNLNSLSGQAQLREFLERIQIPNIPPSCEKDCLILQISYEIEVSIDHVKGKRELAVRIPILIGTIPITIGDFSEEHNEKHAETSENLSNPKHFATSVISSCSMESLSSEPHPRPPADVISNTNNAASFQEASFMSSANLNKKEKNPINKDSCSFKPKYLYYEINEDIEMTPTTMEITKEITIAST